MAIVAVVVVVAGYVASVVGRVMWVVCGYGGWCCQCLRGVASVSGAWVEGRNSAMRGKVVQGKAVTNTHTNIRIDV